MVIFKNDVASLCMVISHYVAYSGSKIYVQSGG